MQALIVEDDNQLSRAMVHILHREGYEVDVVEDGEEGLAYAESGRYDVIIFDVMLPKMDGFTAVEKLRRKGVRTPVLMLTARGSIPDKIEGLDAGADSYMTKPFSPQEMLACLRALTRRSVSSLEEGVRAGDLRLDARTHCLEKGSEAVRLSHKEYLLAELFLANFSHTLTRQQIIEQVWGHDEQVKDNSIEAYVSMLRKKLKFLGSSMEIRAERGIGYKLCGQ